ncbi:MAG: glutamate ABC transporter substrate-binding protein [Treponema sp.]|nr:glutamate ABC transporter substrate-binding protein [Treponema sp.]
MKKSICVTAVAVLAASLVFASGSKDSVSATVTNTLNKAAFDQLVAAGPVARDAEIEANSWAKAVKKAGVLRVGGTRTSFLFSQLDETDGKVRGFDAGLYQLLARYILGDSNKYELTQVNSSTREAVLQNGQVDAVFATYSITDARKKLVSFAGPYFTSQSAILVKAGQTAIKGVDDLAGKIVATQAGSTGPATIAKYAPKATVQEFKDDTEARTALQQGRVDAYVTDYTLLLNAIVRNPNTYEIAGAPFGTEDPYGIGVPLQSDGRAFVNQFLRTIESDGTWTKLWLITLGERTGIKTAPTFPAIQ